MKLFVMLAFVAALAGCAGKQEYIRPATSGTVQNTKVIDRPRSEVWDAAVPALGKNFFVINNLDRSSGLINLSYSGNPELYVDCGRVVSFVKNARGERTYNFDASTGQYEYEIMVDGAQLIFVNRRLDLDGRVNLIFEDIGGQQTRVTANTRYVLKRDFTIRDPAGNSRSTSDTASFNTNGSATFQQAKVIEGAVCHATGRLERQVLDSVQ